MSSNKHIVVSAGGTGGHIVPALAIAEEFIKQGYKVSYIGNKNSMEERLAKEKNLDFYPIDVQKLYRSFTFQHIKFPYKLIKSIIRSCIILNTIKPALFLGAGGFVCGPVGLAAIITKTPLFLQEQNSFPGITTRFLSLFSKKVYLGNAKAKDFFKKDNTFHSGNPIFSEKLKSLEKIDYNAYNLSENTMKLFIIGGSQGSLFINNLILKNLDYILSLDIEIIWQTGKNNLNELSRKLSNRKGIHLLGFTNEMHKIYNSVDLAISRSGALTLAELEVKKIPSLLIPLPSSAGNHQLQNAKDFQKKGFGLVLEQKDVNDFQRTFRYCLENFSKNKEQFQSSLHLDAANTIVNDIKKTLKLI